MKRSEETRPESYDSTDTQLPAAHVHTAANKLTFRAWNWSTWYKSGPSNITQPTSAPAERAVGRAGEPKPDADVVSEDIALVSVSISLVKMLSLNCYCLLDRDLRRWEWMREVFTHTVSHVCGDSGNLRRTTPAFVCLLTGLGWATKGHPLALLTPTIHVKEHR